MDPNKAFVLKSPSDVLVDSRHTYTLQPIWQQKASRSLDSCHSSALKQKKDEGVVAEDFAVRTFLQEHSNHRECAKVPPRLSTSYVQSSSRMCKKRCLLAASSPGTVPALDVASVEATPVSRSFQTVVSTPSSGRVEGGYIVSPPTMKPRRFRRGSGPMHATMNLPPSVLFPLF